MKIIKFFGKGVALLIVGLLVVIGLAPAANASGAAPTPTPSETTLYVVPLNKPAEVEAAPAQFRISHTLVVKNVGSKAFFICSHWGYSNGETEGSNCSGNGSATRYGILQPGKWSDRVYPSWEDHDVDGLEVPAGYRLKEEIPGPNRVQFRCHSRTRWHKISPTISDHHREFYLQKCS